MFCHCSSCSCRVNKKAWNELFPSVFQVWRHAHFLDWAIVVRNNVQINLWSKETNIYTKRQSQQQQLKPILFLESVLQIMYMDIDQCRCLPKWRNNFCFFINRMHSHTRPGWASNVDRPHFVFFLLNISVLFTVW